MEEKLDFYAIEDNAGRLHLFVLDKNHNDEDIVLWGGTGFEYSPGTLREAVIDLLNGKNPIDEGWEDNIESICGVSSQQAYDDFDYESFSIGGRQVVASHDGIYPERMGTAANY